MTSVLDALDLGPVDLVGHSLGGYAAVATALAHPTRVRSLALVGSVPTVPGTSPPLPIRLSVTPGIERVLRRLPPSGEAGAIAVAETVGEGEAIRDYPELIRAMAAHEEQATARRTTWSEYGAVTTLGGWRSEVALGERDLAAVAPPTVAVWGTADPLGEPDAVRAALSAIPDLDLRAVDAGHVPFLGDPQACAEAVRSV